MILRVSITSEITRISPKPAFTTSRWCVGSILMFRLASSSR
jgi:hypothetical protein